MQKTVFAKRNGILMINIKNLYLLAMTLVLSMLVFDQSSIDRGLVL